MTKTYFIPRGDKSKTIKAQLNTKSLARSTICLTIWMTPNRAKNLPTWASTNTKKRSISKFKSLLIDIDVMETTQIIYIRKNLLIHVPASFHIFMRTATWWNPENNIALRSIHRLWMEQDKIKKDFFDLHFSHNFTF